MTALEKIKNRINEVRNQLIELQIVVRETQAELNGLSYAERKLELEADEKSDKKQSF